LGNRKKFVFQQIMLQNEGCLTLITMFD